jgi:probable F420-dependent oxidoreductase
MKINVTLPFDNTQNPEEFLHPEAVIQIATLLERLGFVGACVTDHPCPTGRWLDSGGHHAQDPFVMLSFVAAATRTLRLNTGILVLPYRNPFITARAVATLDVFSGGRVTLGVGAGYLKGEYRALGVEFERRNEIVDEYIAALKAAWTNDEFTFDGTGYQALGNRVLPRPLQKPHPPIMIGGNSRRAIRRAAEMGDGWWPFLTAGPLSATARTAAMSGDEDIAEGIRYLKEHCEKIGRQTLPEIVIGSLNAPGGEWNPQGLLERMAELRAWGVTEASVHVHGRTRAEWCDNAERYGAEVLAKLAPESR